MKKIWWTWDIRMRWAYGFSSDADSYVRNYRRAVDAASRYGVDAIVIWGFLRDDHGGVDAARAVCDYAAEKGVSILPGVGIDAYGGVYYQGTAAHSLDTFIRQHPGSQARNKNGSLAEHRWPPTDKSARLKACPSHPDLIPFYQESLHWLLDTFHLSGFQIEQGDCGLCHCERCLARPRRVIRGLSLSEAAERIGEVVRPALATQPNLLILSETYLGLTRQDVDAMTPVITAYPEPVVLSWQLYNGAGARAKFKIDEGVVSPRTHGNAALRTNNDLFGGEADDRANICRALDLSRRAGLDMTYLYGEYPDDWPLTRANYAAWCSAAG